MPVDVQTQITIQRPRREVATYAADPDNATAWYAKIKSVEWKNERPLGVGSMIAFVAQFPIFQDFLRVLEAFLLRHLLPSSASGIVIPREEAAGHPRGGARHAPERPRAAHHRS